MKNASPLPACGGPWIRRKDEKWGLFCCRVIITRRPSQEIISRDKSSRIILLI
jgi:hypothetical protein